MPEYRSRGDRHDAGKYSAGGAAFTADGYQIQTSTSRLVPGEGANSSVSASLTHAYIVRPTAKWPVGAGNVTSVLCSLHIRARSETSAPITRAKMTARLRMSPRKKRLPGIVDCPFALFHYIKSTLRCKVH